MRIGKITLDGFYNYGNILQSYALQEVLLRYSDRVETLWHESDNFLPRIWWKWSWKEFVKFLVDWKGFRRDFLNGHTGREMVRQSRIKMFCDRYIHIRYSVAELKDLDAEYDCFIVGSDQVWNYHFTNLKDSLLTFAEKGKRLSYAASICTPVVPPKIEKELCEGFRGMRAISVREEEGAEFVQRISGCHAEVHVDPTMLLTAEEWRAVARKPQWCSEDDYLLTYFLGKRPDVIDQIAKEYSLSVVNLLDDSVFDHYVTDVAEFLWLIDHAKLFYTDSFHGTVFSILFRTPFVVCNRMGDSTSEKMSSRIDTLLQRFDLKERRGTKKNKFCISDPLQILFSPRTNDILAEERIRSNDFLRTFLQAG